MEVYTSDVILISRILVYWKQMAIARDMNSIREHDVHLGGCKLFWTNSQRLGSFGHWRLRRCDHDLMLSEIILRLSRLCLAAQINFAWLLLLRGYCRNQRLMSIPVKCHSKGIFREEVSPTVVLDGMWGLRLLLWVEEILHQLYIELLSILLCVVHPISSSCRHVLRTIPAIELRVVDWFGFWGLCGKEWVHCF